MVAEVKLRPGTVNTVGMTSTVQSFFTRPNDSNAYAAGDVVTTATSGAVYCIPFVNAARFPGGGGIIQSAVFIDSVAAATKPDLELYLFDTTPTMQADNAAWNPTDNEALFCVGVIPFPTGSFKTMGANGGIFTTGVGLAFNCASGSTTLFGILVVRNAYTPAALEQFEIRLQILQD